MRFLDLRLAAYGPFTDLTLDLSRGSEGLHVIYGPNEAGKSSALRAVRAFLFGIHGQTRDNFRHDHRDMRIGARLRSRSGEEVVLWRRKGNKDTLLGEDLLPVDEGVLLRNLGGLSAQLFDDAFGLDHLQLVKGGEALLAGEGEVGESLFAAGVGTGSLRRLLADLDGRANDLFRGKGASKPRLNQLLREHKDLRQELREKTVTSHDWHAAEGALGVARAEAARLDEEIRAASRERERLMRLRRCLGRLAERRTLAVTLDSLQAAGPLPLLPTAFEEDRRGVQRRRDDLLSRRATAETEVGRLGRVLADLPLPSDLLRRAEEIEALHAELATYRTAARDRVGLEAKRLQAHADAENALRSLRPGADLDQDGAPTLTVLEKRGVAEGADALAEAAAGLAAAEKARTRLEREYAEAEQRVAGLPVPVAPTALGGVVARARKAGDLESEVAKARGRAATARTSLGAATRALGLFDGAPETLEALALPELATVERFRKDHEAAAAALAAAEGDVRRATEDLATVARERRSLERREVIPTADDLTCARERRNVGWGLVRRQWLEGEDIQVEKRAYDEDRALPEAYEAAVQAADDVADGLREDADRVATKEQLVAREADLQGMLAHAQAACERARAELTSFNAAWRAAWSVTGIAPWLPAEMASWLGRAEQVRVRTREVREVEAGGEATRAEAERWTRDVLAALASVGAAPPATAALTLAGTLDWAENVARELGDSASARAEVIATRDRLARELQAAAQESKTAAEGLAQARVRWAAALGPLGLSPETSPGEARDVLEVLATIESKRREAEGYRRRVEAIDRDEREFAARVVLVLHEVASELASRPAEASLPEVAARLQAARQIATKRRAAEDELARWEESRNAATRELEEAAFGIQRLLAAAGVGAEADLPILEARVQTARGHRDRIAAIERDLAEEGRGVGLAALEAEAASIDHDTLPGLVEEVARRHEDLLQQRARAGEEVGRLGQALVGMGAGASAPEVAERLSAVVAKIRRVAGEYARAHVARVILGREIERYRQAHQGPLLAGAAAFFARITCGAFRALEPDYDESDRPTLKAVRATGERLDMEGMSDGTREQLYLALRLASLERHLAGAEPVPLVVDDLLLRSDDQRSHAILEVLADLSVRTQILFFTHQSRYVDYATGLGRPDTVFVQRLLTREIAQ